MLAAQPISRADLARRLEVNRSTITDLVKPLIASGILREAVPAPGGANRVGRPSVGLSLGAETTFLIGVNIGVRRTQVAAAAIDGQLLGEESFDTLPGSTETLELVSSIIERLRVFPNGLCPVLVSAFLARSMRKRLLFAPHLGWRDVSLALGT